MAPKLRVPLEPTFCSFFTLNWILLLSAFFLVVKKASIRLQQTHSMLSMEIVILFSTVKANKYASHGTYWGILKTTLPSISERSRRSNTSLISSNSKTSICAFTSPATAMASISSISSAVPAEFPTIVRPVSVRQPGSCSELHKYRRTHL